VPLCVIDFLQVSVIADRLDAREIEAQSPLPPKTTPSAIPVAVDVALMHRRLFGRRSVMTKDRPSRRGQRPSPKDGFDSALKSLRKFRLVLPVNANCIA
jgi:hypothetical protein